MTWVAIAIRSSRDDLVGDPRSGVGLVHAARRDEPLDRDLVAQLSADLFFLGSCGVDAVRGATAFDSAEAEVKRAMAGNSAGIVIAATIDKLATCAPFRVARPEAIRHLVVDRVASRKVLAEFEKQGSAIHFA